MIPILVEENYSSNNRFRRLLDGIGTVAAKKHKEVGVFKHIDELPSDCRVVIVVCQSLKWSADRVASLNARGIHPLVFGFPYLDTMYDYSSIAPNYTKSAYRLTKYILSQNAGKVAVLGYNDDSLPDRLKLTGIRYAANEAGQDIEIFGNCGDVTACFSEFSKRCEDIGNIICCNDNIAVVLHSRYPHLTAGRRMGSCSGLKISEFFEQPYPVCRIDYFSAGVQLVSLYRFLAKEETIHSTVMTFDMELSFFGAEVPSLPAHAELYSGTEVDFYGDKSFRSMEKLDRMLSECDETDLGILSDIMHGETYADIAEKRYLAVNTVKYRIKKMMETAEVDSRRGIQSLLDEYKIVLKL